MWWYAGVVLHPARVGRAAPQRLRGIVPPAHGLGPRYSLSGSGPQLLERPSGHEDLVEEFERMAATYERWVLPFTAPVFSRALSVLAGVVMPDARVLDVGCGPGAELRHVARLVPRGEVVGVDLAGEMLRVAADACERRGIRNVAFRQADVTALPRDLDGAFDVAYGCFSHHHFPDPERSCVQILRALRPGGVYGVIDVGREWLRRLATPLARIGDPGFIGFASPAQLCSMLVAAGARRTALAPLLPGIDMVVAQV
jgi:ubiquinone/menaquinone biosynthesis C-methylase UbiE